ncbi:DUF3267 domain-containing protein [uncultured Chryseobacterium sp.]|uniref:DUF3267 domain-containing protein n=1 Tax=uncultured Chryseobacterium sp. TaxID=259322 RepID=UPI00262A224D|nr:DUF3267 domain-containing protein [uncultured Chryseobacterium sp.]
MDFDNYIKELKTINLAKANVVAIGYLVVFAVLFGFLYFLVWGPEFKSYFFNFKKKVFLFIPLLMFFFGIIVHELVHGVFFAKFAEHGWKSVKFGVLWKMLTPYAHCKEPLKIKHYKIAVLAPLVLVGLLPALVGVILGDAILTIFGILMSGSAAGDIMIYNIIKKENPEDYVQDHPSEAGCWIYRKN